MNPSLINEKQQLRNHIKKEFAKYDAETLRLLSVPVLGKIEQSEWFADAKKIACYHSLPNEVNTIDFIEKWVRLKEIYLPVILDGNRMELRRFEPEKELCRNQFQIFEPLEGNCCHANDIELFLTPGAAFDRSLHRLGKGKGYYDRLLAGTKAKKIGLCFNFQLFDSIPHAPHDIPMDAVFTDGEILIA